LDEFGELRDSCLRFLECGRLLLVRRPRDPQELDRDRECEFFNGVILLFLFGVFTIGAVSTAAASVDDAPLPLFVSEDSDFVS
jgi:hypothetical protein